MELHELKILPYYFEQALAGRKNWEIRFNDRNFQVGDAVVLKEWENDKYFGREIKGEIKYILRGNFPGLTKGYVVLSLSFEGQEKQIAHWDKSNGVPRCTHCGYLGRDYFDLTPGYCPRCGRKMIEAGGCIE